jgi:hypothetical protein
MASGIIYHPGVERTTGDAEPPPELATHGVPSERMLALSPSYSRGCSPVPAAAHRHDLTPRVGKCVPRRPLRR